MTQVSAQDAASSAPWYRRESWLAVSIGAIITMFAAVLAPSAFKTLLLVITGMLMLVAVVLLIRKEQTVRMQEASERRS